MQKSLSLLVNRLEESVGMLPNMQRDLDLHRKITSEILHIADNAVSRAVQVEPNLQTIEPSLQRIQDLRELLLEWLR